MPGVLKKLAEVLPQAHALVVDDDSPDGTALAAESHGATVTVRRGVPRGRGFAGREAYRRALDLGPEAVLEMDADGSHDPADAPKILAALAAADVAVGSRAADLGGGDRRGGFRRVVSVLAKLFLRITLGLPLKDPTSGYRAFRAEALRKISPVTLRSEGPEIVEEVYLRAHRLGLKMVEVPIVFQTRGAGESKLTLGKTLKVMLRCVKLRHLF